MSVEYASVQNLLLRRISAEQFKILKPYLRRIQTPLHHMLIAENTPITEFFFPESGFASITAGGPRMVEVGIIGREGVVGASVVLLGSTQSPHRHFTQGAGETIVFDLKGWPEIDAEIPSLRLDLLRFVHTLTVQTAQTAFVNGSYHIEARLARWLLMCQDRVAALEMPITHEFLSIMLSVQRTSVTLALQTLEANGLIRARRGRVEIRDRDRLIDLADDGYGVPEAEYKRLFEDA